VNDKGWVAHRAKKLSEEYPLTALENVHQFAEDIHINNLRARLSMFGAAAIQLVAIESVDLDWPSVQFALDNQRFVATVLVGSAMVVNSIRHLAKNSYLKLYGNVWYDEMELTALAQTPSMMRKIVTKAVELKTSEESVD